MTPSYPSSIPQPNFGPDMSEMATQEHLCPSIFPTPKEPLLEVEETHLVSRTKQGDQKITAAEAWWKKKIVEH